MTPQQKIAFDHSCRFAFETAHPRYSLVLQSGLIRGSIVLTVNSGYE